MSKVKVKSKQVRKKAISPFKNYWEKSNYTLFISGIAILVIGYILMAQGPWDNPVSLSISPIVVLIAYLVVFPLAIFYKKKTKVTDTENVPS